MEVYETKIKKRQHEMWKDHEDLQKGIQSMEHFIPGEAEPYIEAMWKRQKW